LSYGACRSALYRRLPVQMLVRGGNRRGQAEVRRSPGRRDHDTQNS